MGVLEVSPHEVNIKCSLLNGNIVIGMRPSLPIEGISLILGNDLAGEKVGRKVPRYIPCVCGYTFNEGKKGSHKGTR